MYFKANNSFYHGIMFHHFHDNKIFKKSQGSINKDQLYRLIKKIGLKNFLSPETFTQKLIENKLKKNDLCITFDDGLKSQFSVAYPVLESLNLKAFFFIYSSIFTEKHSMLEFYRYFRHYYFDSIDIFYEEFYIEANNHFNCKIALQKFMFNSKHKIKIWKKKHPMYSVTDIKFRLARDFFLGEKNYHELMNLMLKNKNFQINKVKKNLFMSKNDVNQLSRKGNLIGLHSHSHPTNISSYDKKKQYNEFKLNQKTLSKIIKRPIISMSHPNGSYNSNTLNILKKLDVKIGFRQIIDKDKSKINYSNFEVARRNHSEICKTLKII